MKSKSEKRQRRIDERAVQIEGQRIRSFLDAKKMTKVQFAELLGVNPASMNRWANDEEDAPTSTTFLVMVPLLISAGISLMPKHYEQAVRTEFEAAFGEQEAKKNAEKLHKMAHERFMRNNPDIQRARRLFESLQQAWRSIDGGDKNHFETTGKSR